MSDQETTAATPVTSSNPRDAFTVEHQRKAWQIAALALGQAHACFHPQADLDRAEQCLRVARLAMQIATGAL